jgi:hypothetical protein
MLGDFARVVSALASDVKIAENESPRPIDRVFYTFNFFNNIDKDLYRDPTQLVHNVDVFRHMVGFEKTLFDGTMSLGLRVPFYSAVADAKQFALVPTPDGSSLMVGPGGPSFTTIEFGNITAIAKIVLLEDQNTGNLLSGGATLTVPTSNAGSFSTSSQLAYVQPFGSFILNFGACYLHGFTSVTLPISGAESIVWFNDIGVGYYAYRENSGRSWVTAVVPTIEVHATTVLRQPEAEFDFLQLDTPRLNDMLNVTLGTTLELKHHTTLAIGAVVPITGPRPFDIEVLTQLNYHF